MVPYPNLEAFVYFDHLNANGLGNDFRGDTSPDAYNAWKAMANDPVFNVLSSPADHRSTPAPASSVAPPLSARPVSFGHPRLLDAQRQRHGLWLRLGGQLR